MREYQSNSHKSRETGTDPGHEKRAKKVVTGNVKIKKNDGRKIAKMFISEDITNVKSYVIEEVIVPMIKNGIVEAGKTFIEMIFFGSDTSPDRRRSGLNDRVSYRRYYDDRNGRSQHNSSPITTTKFDYKDIVLASERDARNVLAEMRAVLKYYNLIRVSDLYDIIGEEETAPHTAFNYGWVDLSHVEIRRVRDGYLLVLPNAMPID